MSGNSNEIQLTVLKYDIAFTKRSKDIKKNSWFSFPNDLLVHPDFLEIGGDELKWFVWILSICSKVHQSTIRLNIPHAVRILNISTKSLFSMIDKLQGKQIDVASDQTAAVSRPHGGQSTASTLHNNTIHYITEHNTTLQNIITEEPKISVPSVMENRVLFKISKSKEIEIKEDLVHSWADTYPKEFLEESFKEMRSWVLSNPEKSPKSQWARFMNGWFKRGFEQYRKTLKSNPTKLSVDDLHDILAGDL